MDTKVVRFGEVLSVGSMFRCHTSSVWFVITDILKETPKRATVADSGLTLSLKKARLVEVPDYGY
jgi:hypothetical protein